jgi:hypothetical protein
MSEFGGFHASCLREISIATETFVTADLSMSCPPHLDTSVLVFLQSQGARVPAIEIRCERVARISATPSGDGCDSIIASGSIGTSAGWCRLALNFMGAPLTGAPNSSVFVPSRAFDTPDIDVVAKMMAWRAVPEGLGKVFRYRSQGLA